MNNTHPPTTKEDTMPKIYDGYGIIVSSKHCEHFEINDTNAETIEIFTGPHAYDATLETLYSINKQDAYYTTRDYWGTICTETFTHTCGL
jgi:hypothetical protein